MDFSSTWPQPSWVTLVSMGLYIAGSALGAALLGAIDRLRMHLVYCEQQGISLGDPVAQRSARLITHLDLYVRWGSTPLAALGMSVFTAQILTGLLFGE